MGALPSKCKPFHTSGILRDAAVTGKSESGAVVVGTNSASETGASGQNRGVVERSRAPVFVVGCHRSGTNLLYDMLLSAGGFAIYRGYVPVYKMLLPKLGPFDNPETRRKLIALWVRSKGFRRSGLNADELASRIENDCRTGGDFLRITMDAIAERQGVRRWALYDPDNILHIPKIKADIPEALFIHIIRDGRDIALSLKKMAGFRPLPWDRGKRSLLATASYWEWMVRKGQIHGQKTAGDYIEVHYEDLVTNPQNVLKRLGQFVDHDLDYSRIRATALGRLSESNSSFREEGATAERPLNRWKERLSRKEIAELEALVGDCLTELGYELSSTENERAEFAYTRWIGSVYPRYLNTKLWLKTKTPLGRFSDLSEMELQDAGNESPAH